MALKKSALYSSLWKSCDELRGGMDASQYKDYVLTLLFVKYVSDKYRGDPDAMIVVPEGGSFADMVKLKGDKEIGDKINKIISALAEANDLKTVIDVADFNDEEKLGKGKEMVDRLTKLVAIFEGLDFRTNRADGDDLLGDAYEYLMRHFATESGKSKGQFYTPAEVSRVIAKVVGIRPDTRQDQTVYDPTCGSGSLLLKVADEAPRGLTIYGQEMDNATAALARMNTILHNAGSAEIRKGNTLAAPEWHDDANNLKTFDFVVANPPFSQKNWTSGLVPTEDLYNRFELGIPPAKNGDYAFLLHILKSLKSNGKAAVILPHGVLFRGNAEATIRRNLIRRGVIKGIIGLPPNLFYGTGIPACIIVLDKEGAQVRTGIFMVDASKGFLKDGNKNRLRAQDIHRIVDVFNRQLETSGYARLVGVKEIEANDYNLNIPRYIDSSELEDLHDLHAHLNGGIPNRDIDALDNYWQVFPTLRATLFAPHANTGYSQAQVQATAVRSTILQHSEFVTFAERVQHIFDQWQAAQLPTLDGLRQGSDPKATLHSLAEDLLARFAQAQLVDKYDIYQHLMDYWDAAMQDDLYAIAQMGWVEAAKLRLLNGDNTAGALEAANSETPDIVISQGIRNRKKYKADLIPPALIIARYFAEQQAEIQTLQARQEQIAQELEQFIEEHSGEEGVLEDVKTDAGKVTKTNVNKRLRELRGFAELDADLDDERAILTRCLALMDDEAAASRAVKEAQEALDQAVLLKYPALSEAEIKQLVIYDKWLASLAVQVQGEVERVTQTLAGRIKTLEERYDDPLPRLNAQVSELSARVAGHLQRMGLAWEVAA
jgi:type I restriction enzyme M protein